MSLTIFKRKPIVTLYVLGALLLLVTAGLWCYKQTTDPERVFWSTIRQGLRTSGVTIKASQKNPTASVEQTMQYSLGASNRSYSRTTLTQTGTVVVNEMIGTPLNDYTRYVHVKTDQKTADGRELNLSKILGVWAKNENRQLFSQAVLGTGLPIGGMVVPLASLSPELRDKMLTQIHTDNVYNVDFAKAAKKRVDGRMQYTYDIKIKPVAYARLMKSFAGSIGVHDLDQLNPADYSGQPELSLKLTVDAKARRVVSVTLPKGEYTQTYSAYDVPVSVETPTKTISVTELQERLRNL
jgi:hypothetical protein